MVKREFKGVFIPAHIWLDVNLTPVEMKLLGEVNSLDDGTGAYASNAHYLRMLHVKERQLQNIIKSLLDKGYISTEGEGTGRKLLVNPAINCVSTPQKIAPVNIHSKITNNINIISDPAVASSSGKEEVLPTEKRKDYYSFLIGLYSALYEKSFGTRPVMNNHPMQRVVLKSLLQEYSQTQAAAILFAHFDWRGINGKDEYAHERIKNAGFPLTWIKTNLTNYITYLKTTAQLNFEDEDSLREAVERWMVQLKN